MSVTVEFVAAVQKVQTLLDGGIRVTLDLAEDSIGPAAELMAIRQSGLVVRCRCEAVEMPPREG